MNLSGKVENYTKQKPTIQNHHDNLYKKNKKINSNKIHIHKKIPK